MRQYRPSEVVLVSLPLTDTMGRTEREVAAALIVRTCQVQGDRWQPVTSSMMMAVLQQDGENSIEPFCQLRTNPFVRPDFLGLIDKGYAVGDWTVPDAPIELTEKAFQAMEKWVRAS